MLVCAENFVMYKSENEPAAELRAVIPRRSALSGDRGVLIVSSAAHKTKRDGFFVLAQSEYGDVYKVTLENASGKCVGGGEAVANVRLVYFDTVPPCADMCVLKTGFLFAASELGDHALYQFASLGDDAATPIGESSSRSLVETDQGYQPVFFDPTPLRHLVAIDRLESLCPTLDLQCHELLGEETPQLYALCGAGSRSTLKTLKRGVALTEMAVSPLPGNPNGLFTVRESSSASSDGKSSLDAFIVVSFVDATLVLRVGETVEEVGDSGFLGDVPTLSASRLGDDALLQIHPGGLRHVRADGRVNEWRCPGRKTVTKCAANARQALVALSGGEVVYFELDQTGALMEMEKIETSGDVACLSVPSVPDGQLRARSPRWAPTTAPCACFRSRTRTACRRLACRRWRRRPRRCSCCTRLGRERGWSTLPQRGPRERRFGPRGRGCRHGVHRGRAGSVFRNQTARVVFDHDARRAGDAGALLEARLGWVDLQGRFSLAPASYEALEHAAPFRSEQCPEGMVASLREHAAGPGCRAPRESFNAASEKLRYTPRELTVHPDLRTIAIVEADQSCVPFARREGPEGPGGRAGSRPRRRGRKPRRRYGRRRRRRRLGRRVGADPPLSSSGRRRPPRRVGVVRARGGSAFAPREPDEADRRARLERSRAVRVSRVLPRGRRAVPGGRVRGRAHLRARAIARAGSSRCTNTTPTAGIALTHKTPVDGCPGAVCAFKGRLLAGVGSALRVYEFGKKKLLRKAECGGPPRFVTTVHAAGDRAYVGDFAESFFFVRYDARDGSMFVAADDTRPRHVTAATPLDYDTMAGGDKFGNVFVNRLTADLSKEMEDDPTAGKNAEFGGKLNGARRKTACAAQFHVGETVCALTKGTLVSGGKESLLYASLNGTLGALAPFASRDDVDFCTHLEMHMRQEAPPLLGRDHLSLAARTRR